MRILAIADIHGKLELLDRLKDVVAKEHADIVIFSGDIVPAQARGSEWSSSQLEFRDPVYKKEIVDEESKELSTYEAFFSKANELGVPVLVVPGNFDAPRERFGAAVSAAEERYENVHIIHNSEYRCNGFVIRGFGGEVTEDQRDDRFVQRYRRIDIRGNIAGKMKNLILVTHSPPVGDKVSKENSSEKGSPVINDLIHESGAFLLLCGHAHVPQVERINGAFVVNPGPLKLDNYAIVDVKDVGKVEVRHERL